MTDLIGKVVENYEFVSLVGRGGMGVVYKAHDRKLERDVAVKILSENVVDKHRFIERFKTEAKNQAKLSHPNIVTVYGFIEYQNLLGIVMEYVEGESLDAILARQKRLHIYDAVFILRQILSAMGYAHAKGFIHRDIKPSNVILNKEGTAKVVDFGISKSLYDKGVTKTGAKVGTVYYMSPEQVKGGTITHHTDIYSLGCTFYEMLSGDPPFMSENEYDVMEAHLKKFPSKLSEKFPVIPEVVDKIIGKSMRKDAIERFNTCEEFHYSLGELDKLLNEIEEKQKPQPKRPPKVQKAYSIAGFSVFILLLLGLFYFVYLQVNSLLTDKEQLDNLKEYSIQTLFEGEGKSFEQVITQPTGISHTLRSVSFLDENTGYAVGDSGTVIYTRDAGETWQEVNLNENINYHDGYFRSNGRSFVVGDNSTIYHTANLMDWKKTNLGGGYSLFTIKFVDENSGFILGNNGVILKTTDGGNNWRRVSSGTDRILYDIDFVDNELGYIVGWNGIVLRTNDRGETWSPVDKFTNKYLKSVDFWNSNGVTVGGGGIIYHSDDGGESWDEVIGGQINSLQKVRYLSEDYVVAVGARGTILISEDGGENWKLLENKEFANLTNITVSPDGSLYITGVNGTIIKLL